MSRYLIIKVLSRCATSGRSTTNGREAWDILQSENPPRLVVLDWMMPVVDGVEVCRRIRENEMWQYTYVLLLTARSYKCDIVAALKAGRHHRSGGLRNRTSRSLKANVANQITLDFEIHGKVIAAQRVVPLRPMIDRGRLAEIARSFAMLQDHVLIEKARADRPSANTSRTFSIPRTKTSTSLFVLYIAKEAHPSPEC